MTPAFRIAEIRKRLKDATPGPWSHDNEHTYINTPEKRLISFWEDAPQISADLSFIANAPTDIVFLLEQIENCKWIMEETAAFSRSGSRKHAAQKWLKEVFGDDEAK